MSHDPISSAQDLLAAVVPGSVLGADDMRTTPERMFVALAELTSGYSEDPTKYLKVFAVGHDPGMVVVRDMPFASVCEHHVLPFTGTASVVYIPTDKVIGLSKIPRILRAVSRRLQVQERIGAQVADVLMDEKLGASGVMVVVRGRHTCMALRGVESPGEMVTSCIRGLFANDPAARHEALELMRG
jgi:GTP cyclohydrolase IA